jgi:hypothetical protein
MIRKRYASKVAIKSGPLSSVPMSPSMLETAKTVALQRRLKRSIDELERMDPDCDLLGEYRAMNTRILRHIRRFRVGTELRLSRARTKAERRAAAEYLHLVVLAESEFATGVELEN